MLAWRIVAEAYLAEQIYTQQDEQHHPQGYEHLAVEYAPTVGQIGNRQELQRQYQLYESENHFHGVEP